MSQAEKNVFLEKSQLLLNDYNLKLIEWEAKMMTEGHDKLVRVKFINIVNKELKKIYRREIAQLPDEKL